MKKSLGKFIAEHLVSVSYTHLDVYKRQVPVHPDRDLFAFDYISRRRLRNGGKRHEQDKQSREK